MPQKLPFKTFLKSFELAPRAAINLLVKDKNKNILLTKRINPPFANYWHLPGSFLIKGETIESCIERILKDELGIPFRHSGKPRSTRRIQNLSGQEVAATRDAGQASMTYKLLGVFDNIDKDPRGHIVDIIYGFTLTEKFKPKPIGYTKEIKFFQKLPPNIGFNHKVTLSKLGHK